MRCVWTCANLFVAICGNFEAIFRPSYFTIDHRCFLKRKNCYVSSPLNIFFFRWVVIVFFLFLSFDGGSCFRRQVHNMLAEEETNILDAVYHLNQTALSYNLHSIIYI